MAHQDYVSRPKARTKNPYKKEAPAPAPGLSIKNKLLLLLVIALLSGFSYFLWFLKSTPPAPAPVASEQPAVKSVKTQSAELPAPPKEKWEYIDNLMNKEVEVGEYETSNNGPYKMQCGAFKVASQADTLKAKMAFAGVGSYIKKVVYQATDWYVVIAAPYQTKRLAEKDKHALRRNNITDCQISLLR